MGRLPDPSSARSDQRGYKLKSLPASAARGKPPEFPLPEPSPRELELWSELWRLPQARLWRSEKWRVSQVGLYCRTLARCEAPDASASLLGQLHKLADNAAVSQRGLQEAGYFIQSADPVKRDRRKPQRRSSRDRLTVIDPALIQPGSSRDRLKPWTPPSEDRSNGDRPPDDPGS